MKLTELIEAAGGEQVTPRFVRYLISEGIIAPPSGGRTNADYGHAHLQGVLSYLRLREMGFSLAQARGILAGTTGGTIPLEIARGLTLHVDLTRLDPAVQPTDVATRVHQIVTEILSLTKGQANVDA